MIVYKFILPFLATYPVRTNNNVNYQKVKSNSGNTSHKFHLVNVNFYYPERKVTFGLYFAPMKILLTFIVGKHISFRNKLFYFVDMLKKSSPSRIINVASIAAKYAKNFTPETINSYTDHISSYANSKLGNILFTQELGKKLKDSNISVFSLHPGITNTGIAIKNFNPIFRVCAAIFSRVFFMASIN